MLWVHNTLLLNKQQKHFKAKRNYCGYFIATKIKWRNCAKKYKPKRPFSSRNNNKFELKKILNNAIKKIW